MITWILKFKDFMKKTALLFLLFLAFACGSTEKDKKEVQDTASLKEMYASQYTYTYIRMAGKKLYAPVCHSPGKDV
ncbi:MAG: hypothetical protein HC913_09085 [Microscillaceae bacterium]|nr:hypothetical protein [Microscillaceae bacterium]